MIEEAALDTTFLIDLQRSRRNEKRQRADVWLERNSTVVLKIPVIVLGEFAAGFEDADEAVEIVELRHGHEILEIGSAGAIRYGSLYRKMRENGNLIGGNDLWIAAIALEAGLSLVSRNANHFARVEGLNVIDY